MRERIKQLKAARAAVWAEAEAFLAEERSAGFSSEDNEKWDAFQADLSARDAEIDAAEAHYRQERAEQTVTERSAETNDNSVDEEAERQARQVEAFGRYLRNGEQRLSDEDLQVLRAQSVGTNTAGGFTVPEGFWNKVTETMKAFGGVAEVVNAITTETGNDLPWMTNDDTSNVGSIIAEGATVPSAADLVFGQKILGAYMYTSDEISASYELLDDSALDIEALVARKVAMRLARIRNQHLTSGTGTGQPDGIVTGSTTGVTSAAAATDPTYDLMLGLIHSVDPAYRGSAGRFMFNDDTLFRLRKLKDGDGRPLWEPSLAVDEPDRFLGIPYTINQDMANFGTTANVPVLFGDFNSGYVLRTVRGLQLISHDLNIRARQKSWFSIMRFDGTKDDTSAYKSYVIG